MFIKLKTNRWLAIHEQSLILFPFYVRFFLKVFLYYFNSIYYLPCINRYINTYIMVYKMLIQKRIKIGQFYSYKTCLWLFWFELIFCINFLFRICHKYLFYLLKWFDDSSAIMVKTVFVICVFSRCNWGNILFVRRIYMCDHKNDTPSFINWYGF